MQFNMKATPCKNNTWQDLSKR